MASAKLGGAPSAPGVKFRRVPPPMFALLTPAGISQGAVFTHQLSGEPVCTASDCRGAAGSHKHTGCPMSPPTRNVADHWGAAGIHPGPQSEAFSLEEIWLGPGRGSSTQGTLTLKGSGLDPKRSTTKGDQFFPQL